MSSEVAIDVRGLGKRYKRGALRKHYGSLVAYLLHKCRRVIGRDPREAGTEEFWALKNATFSVRRGENVGVIGLNGAGKSTLLKLLSRITEPTTGSARIVGRVGALLEVGTGFHPQLTGRENVFLYGSVLGMKRVEVEAKFDDIVKFSEVGDFIETPVKHYSSGMYVRLAFSVAVHLDPEILFLDEVLAVGDLGFQRKCMEYAKKLQQRDATILFVSHSMFSIKSMCDRVIYVKGGQIAFDGPVEDGIALYEEDCRGASAGGVYGSPEEWPIQLTNSAIVGVGDKSGIVFDMGESLLLRFFFHAREQLEDPNFIVSVVRSDGVSCIVYSTEVDGVETGVIAGNGVIELRLPPVKLVAEMYTISFMVRRKGFGKIICNQTATTLHIRDEMFNSHFGVFREKGEWRIHSLEVNG